MEGFGNVDFVIADVSDAGDVQQFLSVELQTIDITGSVRKAYDAIRAGKQLDKRPSFGFNWKNVYKRYVTQLIDKGFFHHHWNSKIVAVIPEQVYRYIRDNADFMVIPDVRDSKVNIIFMTYVLVDDPDRPGEFIPRLTTVEGTSHASLKDAVLYKQAPSRDAFVERINAALKRVKAIGG
jgi:Restriction endonuclease NotI.